MLVCYRFCSYTFWLACLMPDIAALAIHQMNAINEITAKIDHVSFTWNWFIVLQKWAHRCMLLIAEKMFWKYQQILATAMKSISRKGSFLKVVNVLWKRTLPQLFFYIATLNSSKFWKCPVHRRVTRNFLGQGSFLRIRALW